MARGNQVGEYSFRFPSATFLPGPAGSTLAQVNWEGPATGFGTVFGTATYTVGNRGTFSWNAAAFLENGDIVTGSSNNGAFETIGPNRWKTTVLVRLSDGNDIFGEGEIDLASRTWSGKIFEWT